MALAAAMEYLCGELVQLAGYRCSMAKKKRITPRHIMLAIAEDDVLTALFQNQTLSESGVAPFIHRQLLP